MKLYLNKRYKMKKVLLIVYCIFMSFCLTGCENKEIDLKEAIEKIKLESELVSYEALYHNVIEHEKKVGNGLTHFLEKDREMFVEYTGSIELGIDLSKVKIEVKDTEISVFVPKAIVVGEPDIVKFDENDFIENRDGLINKNPITLDDSEKAFQKAQNNMKEFASNDKDILNQAQLRAQLILEEMIKKAVPIDESNYTINW